MYIEWKFQKEFFQMNVRHPIADIEIPEKFQGGYIENKTKQQKIQNTQAYDF